MKILFTILFFAAPAFAADVPVSSHMLDRGTVISEADLSSADGGTWSTRVILRDATAIIGKELKRPMNEGEPFRFSDLKAPTLVKRGQVVTLLVSNGGLTIAASGRAMQDGSVGDFIKTQNVASRTIVEGIVGRDGTIKIDLVGAPRLPDAQQD